MKPYLLSLILLLPALAAGATDPERLRQDFITEMTSRHGFDAATLERLLAQAEVKQSILEAIARPAEKRLDWGQYRKIFLTRERIRGGLRYWQRHADTLARAEQRYGVPPEIIVAIIGVETRYGRHAGRYRVLDALSTLGFHYPPRAAFFRRELGEFLLLAREEGVDPTTLLGSYAGAMGKPQFIPSSFRAYAVDFDSDGRRDIWKNDADVIGSVANYFARHGWRRGEPVARRVRALARVSGTLAEAGYKPHTTVGRLLADGLRLATPLPESLPAALLALRDGERTEHWVVLNNFYAITRYNHSPLYAMAVFQLADSLRRLYDRDDP